MEVTINDLKEEVSQEQEKCKKLQDDLTSYTERETKMSQSITSVSTLISIFFISFMKFINSIYLDDHIMFTG